MLQIAGLRDRFPIRRDDDIQALQFGAIRRAAVAYLDELKAEIENAHAELVLIGDQFTERVSEHIRDGIMDGAVKARAAAMGWTPELFPPFIAHPATDDETVKAAYSVENMHREPYPDTAGD